MFSIWVQLKSQKGFKLSTLCKCTFQGVKNDQHEQFQTPAIPTSVNYSRRVLVIDQSGKILSFFRTQQLNPVPMFRTAKIAKNHGRIVKSRGVNFGPGIFAGFDNCSHAIIPVTKNPEYPPPRPPRPIMGFREGEVNFGARPRERDKGGGDPHDPHFPFERLPRTRLAFGQLGLTLKSHKHTIGLFSKGYSACVL